MRTIFFNVGIWLCALSAVLPQSAYASPLAMNGGALEAPALSALYVSATTSTAAAESAPLSWNSSIPSGSPDLILLLRSGLTADSDLPAPRPAADVQTRPELAAYAEGQMRADPRVEDLSLSSNSVGLTYAVPATLLGVFPVPVPLRGEIGSDGSTEINYPWYGTFLSINTAPLIAALKAAAQKVLTTQPLAHQGEQLSLSPLMQAELLSDMHAVLRGGGLPQETASSHALASAQ